MKIALYIEDGLEQIVLTPEGETERSILGKLHDGSRELSIHLGSFYHCLGGWLRHGDWQGGDTFTGLRAKEDASTMIVLRRKDGEA